MVVFDSEFYRKLGINRPEDYGKVEKRPDNWSGASNIEMNQAVINHLYYRTSKKEKDIYPNYARRIDQAMLLAAENHFSIMPVFRDDKFIGWWAGQAAKMESVYYDYDHFVIREVEIDKEWSFVEITIPRAVCVAYLLKVTDWLLPPE